MQTISFWDIMMLNVFLLKDKRTDWGWHFVWILFETLYPQMWPSANSQKLSFHSSLCEQTLFFFFYWRQGTKRKVKIFIRIMQNAWDMICTHYILLEDNCSTSTWNDKQVTKSTFPFFCKILQHILITGAKQSLVTSYFRNVCM